MTSLYQLIYSIWESFLTGAEINNDLIQLVSLISTIGVVSYIIRLFIGGLKKLNPFKGVK